MKIRKFPGIILMQMICLISFSTLIQAQESNKDFEEIKKIFFFGRMRIFSL